ncbi:Maf1 regulator-domain-containing protein [Scheffersomyces amazonensis]|uniref:Maf1 regulator-domain-containing protein n=1 Tax=Scheffersomyces amazonensis TaxID=1078765 RepID=UPI00315C4E01
MKFIDEIDIELVNQELNFNSQDNSLVIKGGCDLFTTKPIGSDRKLFKTIDKHLDQIIEDNQLSRSIEWERKNSVHSLIGSSASPPNVPGALSGRRDSYSTITERDRRQSSTSSTISRPSFSISNPENINISLNLDQSFEYDPYQQPIDESPFGPLKNVTTRKTFAYLIAILNTTFPDHDFSNLQPTTENFHRIHNPEDLVHKFNNIMISLGKKEDILNWIWDTINVYMDVQNVRNSPSLSAQSGGPVSTSRKNSFNNNNLHPYSRNGSTVNGSNNANNNNNSSNNSPPASFNPEICQIYQFQPSDESILEDLNYPYQTMWSNYWFIYNKKKKRVAFIYLTAINSLHYSSINNSTIKTNGNNRNDKEIIHHEDDEEDVDVTYDDEEVILDDEGDEDFEVEDNDVMGDIEI